MVMLPLLSAVFCLTASGGPTSAQPAPDQTRARAAVEAGEILPLQTIIERLRTRLQGRILEVELEREDGRWVYEIELLLADGHKRELEIDATSARVLEDEDEDEDEDESDDDDGD